MGSGASSNVKSNVDGENQTIVGPLHSNGEESVPSTSATRPSSNISNRKHNTKVVPLNLDTDAKNNSLSYPELLTAAEERVKLAEEKAKGFESQLTELEGQKLELLDEVSALENQVETLQKPSGTTVDWSETLHAKDQYIEYLETQSKHVETQLALLKKKFRKKLRLLRTQLSEAKQGQSVQSFEQQQQVQQLKEETNKLKEQLRRHPRDSEDPGEEFADNRTKIILELSSRVSEQDDKIIELEQKLAEKTREITRLGGDEGDVGKPVNNRTSIWSSSLTEDSQQDGDYLIPGDTVSGGDTHDQSQDRDELRSLADEIKQLQKPKKKKVPTGGADVRESSGISRDSGIVALSNGNVTNGANTVDSDWGDSDSDIDTDTRSRRGGDVSHPSSAHSHVSAVSDIGTPTSTTSTLDPASIRQISAAKLRKGKTTHGKPPVYKQTFNSDVDSLINNIDMLGRKNLDTLAV